MNAWDTTGRLEDMRVVVDTSAIYPDPLMRRQGRVLLDAALDRELTLIVPEVVVQELLGLYRRRYNEATRAYVAATRDLRGLGQFEASPTLPSVDDATVLYEATLRGQLHDSQVQIPGPTGASHEDLVERAIARRKPFKENGAGYRDTLIWLTVLEEAEADEVAFITNNTHDFASAEAGDLVLAQDLVDDAAARGLEPDRIVIFSSIRDFLQNRGLAEPPVEDLNQYRHLLIPDEATAEALGEIIATDLERYPSALGYDFLTSGEPETWDIERAYVEELDVIGAFENDDSDDTIVILSAAGGAEVRFAMDVADARRLAPAEVGLIGTWRESVAEGTANLRLHIEAEAVLRGDELIDVSVVFAERVRDANEAE